MHPVGRRAPYMSEGITNSEQFVYEVCQKSFLSLWSYANPQGSEPGKELCDVLIVCDPDVIDWTDRQAGVRRQT